MEYPITTKFLSLQEPCSSFESLWSQLYDIGNPQCPVSIAIRKNIHHRPYYIDPADFSARVLGCLYYKLARYFSKRSVHAWKLNTRNPEAWLCWFARNSAIQESREIVEGIRWGDARPTFRERQEVTSPPLDEQHDSILIVSQVLFDGLRSQNRKECFHDHIELCDGCQTAYKEVSCQLSAAIESVVSAGCSSTGPSKLIRQWEAQFPVLALAVRRADIDHRLTILGCKKGISLSEETSGVIFPVPDTSDYWQYVDKTLRLAAQGRKVRQRIKQKLLAQRRELNKKFAKSGFDRNTRTMLHRYTSGLSTEAQGRS